MEFTSAQSSKTWLVYFVCDYCFFGYFLFVSVNCELNANDSFIFSNFTRFNATQRAHNSIPKQWIHKGKAELFKSIEKWRLWKTRAKIIKPNFPSNYHWLFKSNSKQNTSSLIEELIIWNRKLTSAWRTQKRNFLELHFNPKTLITTVIEFSFTYNNLKNFICVQSAKFNFYSHQFNWFTHKIGIIFKFLQIFHSHMTVISCNINYLLHIQEGFDSIKPPKAEDCNAKKRTQ